jgi:drug/metabolite transporter (DMT)-like permease
MSQKPAYRPILVFLLTLTGVVFFSAKSVLVKIAYQYDIDALSLVTLRLLFSAPFYVVIMFFSAKPAVMKSLKASDYFKIFFLGIMGYYLASILDFWGLEYVSASLERMILFIYPTMVLLISAVFMQKKISIEQKLAVIITYFGVALAFFQNNYATGKNLWLGSFLILGSALSYAIYLIGTDSIISKFGSVLFTSMVMIVSTFASGIHYVIVSDLEIFSFSREVYLIVLVMAIVSTVIPTFLISEAIKQWGPSNVAIVGSIGPISTIMMASVFLGEKITIFELLGTVIVISGILVISTGGKIAKVQPVVKEIEDKS